MKNANFYEILKNTQMSQIFMAQFGHLKFSKVAEEKAKYRAAFEIAIHFKKMQRIYIS